jgi:SAM-dependent methyltransferase
MYLKSILHYLYNSVFISKIFHTLRNDLLVELRGCKTVLDLGCGPSSPLQFCDHIEYSIGVEGFEPYLERSKQLSIHNKYISGNLEDLEFEDNSFDTVIMLEVIEHLDDASALMLLKKAEKWAKVKVIVSSPNGFVPQKAIDGNALQEHKSGWSYERMKGLGFRCRGMAGIKYLRIETQDDSMDGNLLSSIRYRPRVFWFLLAAISQVVTYRIPSIAFSLLSVKDLR